MNSSQQENLGSIGIGMAWCLAWGEERTPALSYEILQQMRQSLQENSEVPRDASSLVEQVRELQALEGFPEKLEELRHKYPQLWQQQTRIGLIYGGATKIKQYVFEAAKIQDIRGASAILDRINQVDLPAFFGCEPNPKQSYPEKVRQWLNNHFPGLTDALIPELIVYTTGGNILAFCPAAFISDLANAIEKRYTEEAQTANSCAVGDTFRLLELRFGLLKNPIEQTPWLKWYKENQHNFIVQSYFGKSDKLDTEKQVIQRFKDRKSFNEIAGNLASQFQKRRNGNALSNAPNRPLRRYPPMLETHPHLVRDESHRRLAITQARQLPQEPWYSEASARKRLAGEQAKNKTSPKTSPWYKKLGLSWQPGYIESWFDKFEDFLEKYDYSRLYYKNANNEQVDKKQVEAPQSLTHVGNASDNFIAYIYADGNNMGGYIQKIRTPEEYKQFSKDISQATEYAVYLALAKHLHPHKLKNIDERESRLKNGNFIHPFEIITVGGDDIFVVVPANKALEIAKVIGDEFEKILTGETLLPDVTIRGNYKLESDRKPETRSEVHRYLPGNAPFSKCKLSMSSGVLITSKNTPIYYAEGLVQQLLKSAKSKAKDLKKNGYYGGTVDLLSLKSVTMISSNVKEFREQGLVVDRSQKNGQKLKLYASPYTLYELGGFIKTAKALKNSDFPKSQIYQIRNLLAEGKNTAMLNYCYFRVRLSKQEDRRTLQKDFEEAWCPAKSNNGNLAPWMSILAPQDKENDSQKSNSNKNGKTIYETIWRELVDIYPFIDKETANETQETENFEVHS